LQHSDRVTLKPEMLQAFLFKKHTDVSFTTYYSLLSTNKKRPDAATTTASGLRFNTHN